MHIDIYDVGHGACSVITCPNGTRVMIDCGVRRYPSWRPSAVFHGLPIEVLILANLDEDHLRDLWYVIRQARVKSFYSNPTVDAHALAAMKREHGMGIGAAAAHEVLSALGPGLYGGIGNTGEVSVWVYSNRYGIDFVDTNNLSVATFVRFGNFTILLSGDLESAGWLSLLRNASFRSDLASTNVLVASHHGRKNGQCEQVFDVCQPDVIIFSDDQIQYDSQDTSGWYARRARGIPDLRRRRLLQPSGYAMRYVLTTRKDGTMQIQVSGDGSYTIFPTRFDIASPTSNLLSA